MKKTDRQMLIKQIIMNQEIVTQDELLKKLEKEGIVATQATISRDIKELNLIKVPSSSGGSKYALFQSNSLTIEERLASSISNVVEDVTQVEFMNIIKTQPGSAHVIGALVDEMDSEKIAGSVAGNDTILLISQNKEDALEIDEYFNKYLDL